MILIISGWFLIINKYQNSLIARIDARLVGIRAKNGYIYISFNVCKYMCIITLGKYFTNDFDF